MHHSRLAGFIIDCQNSELEQAANFWSSALGLKVLGPDGENYIRLDASALALVIEVQRVAHESRVHLDLETDDVEAEVRRLEALGAVRVKTLNGWWVMQAPTAQRFCVVPAKRELSGLPGTTRWP